MRSVPHAASKTGCSLRKDAERGIPRSWFPRDPVKLCRTPHEYLQLASRYESIVTDRLHFAICGMLLGRQVVLLPNSYHKPQHVRNVAARSRLHVRLRAAGRHRTAGSVALRYSVHLSRATHATTVRIVHEPDPVLHACRSAS